MQITTQKLQLVAVLVLVVLGAGYFFYSRIENVSEQLYATQRIAGDLEEKNVEYAGQLKRLANKLKETTTELNKLKGKEGGPHPDEDLLELLERLEKEEQERATSMTTTPKPLQGYNEGKRTWTILVLTYNRLPSLKRLLTSIAKADYEGQTVNLEINVDFPLSSENVGKEDYRGCRDYAENFTWPHGYKRLHYRTKNIGLMRSWYQAWWPNTDNDIGFILEDDVEVSPNFFKFTKKALDAFYFNETNRDPRMAFLCLYPLNQAGFPEFGASGGDTHDFCKSSVGFFKQFGVATWGAVVMPKVWRGFLKWSLLQLADPKFKPRTPTKHWSNGWDNAWSPWFFRYEFENGLYSLRYCFPDRKGVLVNHQEKGEHYGSRIGAQAQLIADDQDIYFNIPKTKTEELPCWNFHVDPELKKVATKFCKWLPWQK